MPRHKCHSDMDRHTLGCCSPDDDGRRFFACLDAPTYSDEGAGVWGGLLSVRRSSQQQSAPAAASASWRYL